MKKMRAIMIALSVMICLPLSAQTTSYKIVLGEDEVPLVFVLDKDTLVNFVDGKNLPESMKIGRIELDYNGREKGLYLYAFSENERTFYGKLTNNLDAREIDDQGGLSLEKGKQYTFVREGREWKLDYSNGEPPAGAAATDASGGDDSSTENDNNEPNSEYLLPLWLQWTLLGLTPFLVMAVIAEGVILLVSARKKSKDKSVPQESAEQPQETPQPGGDSEVETLRKRLESLMAKINEIHHGERISEEDKLDKIRENVLSGINAGKLVKRIKDQLGLSEDKDILGAIENLKQPTSNVQQPDEKEIRGKYAQMLIKKINDCGNKELKEKMEKAQEEKADEGVLEVVDKFIKILAGTDFKPKENNNQVDAATDLRNKILSQFKSMGYTEYEGRTIKPSDFFNELIARLKASNRPSDEELTTQLIKNNSLTDEHKNLLTNSLIGLINENLDDNHKIEGKSPEEFVKLIVERIQAPNTLEEAQEMVRKYDDDLLKSVEVGVKELFPDESFESAQLLANALIKMAQKEKQTLEDERESVKLVIEDLNKKIISRDGSHQDGEDPIDLINKYTGLVDAKEKELKGQINEKENAVEELTKTKADNEQVIANLQSEKDGLMAETDAIIEKLHSYAGAIEQLIPKNILCSCSDDNTAQCEELETRLDDATTEFVNKLKDFSVPQGTTPAVARKMIQEELIAVINTPNSPINIICRYYAYSHIPFMTDPHQEYGVTINLRNISELFDSVNSLYVSFGISFSIPPLFVMDIKDGDYENVTGSEFGQLIMLCPDAYNHCDKIDSQTKQENVIVDIVNVGYSVDGTHIKTTEVLTH